MKELEYEKLRDAIKEAQRTNAESFECCGSIFYTKYAVYLLEYIEEVLLDGKDRRTTK